MHLRLLVEGHGRGLLLGPPDALAGASSLLDRVPPGAVQLHDFRAMHQASAGKSDHLGLRLAPPRQGGGPFPGTGQRVDLLTGFDHAAIDQPRHERR